MYRPELLNDLLITILCIQKELKGSDIEKVKIAQEAYQELLDDFYDEYQDNLASNQYMAAKDDPDYFSVLIQLAYHDQVQKNDDSEEEQSIPYFNWKTFTQI
jgi:predicted HD phosphohydrolase